MSSRLARWFEVSRSSQRLAFALLAVAIASGGSVTVRAQSDETAKPAGVPKSEQSSAAFVAQPTVVAGDLNTPLGVAVERDTSAVAVAESGAGRILRLVDGKMTPAVVEFPLTDCGPSRTLKAGPSAISFFDKQTIAALDIGSIEGADSVRLYKLPNAGEPATPYATTVHKIGPQAAGRTASTSESWGGLVTAPSVVLFSSFAGEPEGWLSRTFKTNERWSDPSRFVATRDVTGGERPMALTFSPRSEVVSGQIGTWDKPKDSRISFLNLNSGKLLANYRIDLHDVVALEYSPKTGQLYALDLAWSQPADAGLYQVVATYSEGRLGVQAKKIVALPRPTSLAFQADGTLYVTTLGAVDAPVARSGQLWKITPGL